MKKYLFLLACFGFLMARCTKDNEANATIKVSGKVLQVGTLKPIVNAKVFLINETPTGGPLSGTTSSSIVDTVRTDANGFYVIDKTGIDKNGSYIVTATADKYFKYDPSKYLTANNVFVGQDIVLDPHAWIKIHVKNQNPVDSNDRILFGNTIGDLIGSYTGKNVELNYINRCPGNTKLFASWGVLKNGAWVSFKDTITVPAHDTLIYQILY
jgi:hypothetical protein